MESIIELLVFLKLLLELLGRSDEDSGSEVISSWLLLEAATLNEDHTGFLQAFKSVEKIRGNTLLLGFFD